MAKTPNEVDNYDKKLDKIIKLLKESIYTSEWGLPLSKNWSWFVDDISAKTILAGKTEKLWDRKKEEGFLISFFIVTNNPNLTIRVKLDHAVWQTSIATLYTLGFYQIGQDGMNVLKYDALAGIYTLYYIAKGWPGDPYKDESWIELYNGTTSDIIVTAAQLNRIVLKPIYISRLETKEPDIYF